MSFSVVKLGEVCSFVRGLTYSKSDEVEFSSNVVIRANNIDLNTHELNFNELRYIDESIVVKDDKKLKKNDILICTASGSKSHLGKVALVEEDLNMAFGGFMGALRSDSSKISPQYLYRILISDIFKRHVDGLSDGANINNLKFSQIENLEIPLPSLATQQKIVEKLDRIFSEIDRATVATEANVKNAEALFQSYLTEVFERDDEGWSKVKLKDVVKELITGPFGSSLHKSDYVDSGVPVINPQNLINGKIIPLDKTMVAESTKERLKKYSLKARDIIIARRGEMGRCGLVDAESEGWLCGTGSMIIRLNDKANENFVFQLLQSNRVRRELESTSIGATMSNLNQSILLDVQFSLPPIDFQLRTMEAIKELSEKSYSLSCYYINKINEHSQLKQSVLKQAFNGELVKE